MILDELLATLKKLQRRLDTIWLNKLEKFIQQLQRLLGKDERVKTC